MSLSSVAPYGSWESPITSDTIVTTTVGLSEVFRDGDELYWLEARPKERGRSLLMQRTGEGEHHEVTPSPFNVRSRVHEYGGGAARVECGVVYFVNFSDQRLYSHRPGERPRPLTPEAPLRYADGLIDHSRGLSIWVLEDHRRRGEPQNALAAVPLEGGDPEVIVSGNDFYACPRISPDGSHLVWLAWDHPNMPWDRCELWLAEVAADGSLSGHTLIAGDREESIFQPEWSPDGTLYFVSDRTNWWNLYRFGSSGVEPVITKEAEFGRPYWQLGTSTYAFDSAQRIVCTYCLQGEWRLATLDTAIGELTEIDAGYTQFRSLSASKGVVTMIAASPTQPAALVRLGLDDPGRSEVLVRSSTLEIDPGYVSVPTSIEFPTGDGLSAYGFYYAPKNSRFTAPEGDRPPLLVKSHGGPTGATDSSFNLGIQYWASRGIAVLDVNYGGSTGYGREYRKRLEGSWGVVDVDDCVNGARYLAEQGLVDGSRLAITGGSAGGYTTLCALTFREVFAAGASHFGVSDCEALAKETHKFESRYLERLIGPYPERRDLYRARSPLHHAEQLSCPIIFFQGLEDEIVPPNQAEKMVTALRIKGLPVAYLAFPGEQHGFRQAAHIKRALDGEFYFYGRVFGFEPAEEIEPLPIENL